MKIKTIKTEKELKAGLYIRAVINYAGAFWIEFVKIKGRPFYETKKSVMYKSCQKYRKVHTDKTVGPWHSSNEEHIGDLTRRLVQSVETNPSKVLFKTELIPYSNKVWNYLSGVKNVRDFAGALVNKPITDEEMVKQVKIWENAKNRY